MPRNPSVRRWSSAKFQLGTIALANSLQKRQPQAAARPLAATPEWLGCAWPVQLSARQPRPQILTHHLIRRSPFRPPAYLPRGPLQLAITACGCPRHTCSAAHNQGPRGVVPSTEEQGRDRTNHSPSNSLSSMPSSNMPTAATSSSSCCAACNAATPHTAIGSTKPPTRLVQHSARRRWSART